MPGDALLFIFKTEKTILVPWDVILAKRMAEVEEMIPFTDFQRENVKAIRGVLERGDMLSGTIELSSTVPYPMFQKLREALPGASLICREEGIDDELLLLR